MNSDDFPPALQPVYWAESFQEDLLLYEGRIEVRSETDSEARDGQVHFQWLPRPRLYYWVGSQDSEAGIRELFDPQIRLSREVELPDLKGSLDSLPNGPQQTLNRDDFPNSSGGYLPSTTYGSPNDLKRVVFNVINFQKVVGTSVTRVDADFKRNRILLRWDGWRVTLDSEPRSTATFDDLRRTGGFGFTHVGQIERVDAQSFSFPEAEFVLEALHLFLSFARGALASPCLPVGFGDDEQPQFLNWRLYLVDSWRGAFSWLDTSEGDSLEAAFPGFMERWSDEFWRDTLRRAIRIYMEANDPNPLETAIVIGQTGLELLAWSTLFEDEGWLREGEGKLPASARLRLFLKKASIPTEIPASLSRLGTIGNSRTPAWDGPKAITEIRNALVHPKKADELQQGDILREGWRLMTWYLELAILKVVDYGGSYGNRLASDRWVGDVEPVPWAVSV